MMLAVMNNGSFAWMQYVARMDDVATCLKVIDFSARKIGVFLDE